jgi:virginiamycin B lyase
VWSDSHGRIWVSEWVQRASSRCTTRQRALAQWKLPAREPGIYAVYVDERDIAG